MDISALETAILEAPLETPQDLQAFQKSFLKRGGALDAYYGQIRNLPPTERPAFGQKLQRLRFLAESRYQQAEQRLKAAKALRPTLSDPTFPAIHLTPGARHALSLVESHITQIFMRIGFTLADGPEIEDDWHNFTALNFEADHPARDMQDTFFVDPEKEILLRTHTSTIQVRVMERQKPPIRILAPGRVYRRETISARAHVYFHQIEGLYVDEGVSAADLKATLTHFVQAFFGPDTPIRWRASYFPFTEMSAELDIGCQICQGKGCPVCKHTGWVEVLGCGMVDPNVLQACGIDPDKYTGYAFGMGVERLAQLKYQIPDLRLFSQNHYRFLANFRGYESISH